LNAEANEAAIRDAIARATTPEFRASLRGTANPYGDGQAAERIVEVLRTVPLGEEILIKKAPVLAG
jgi:UDP-N-acetylglucosamine 2-epimerase